MRNNPIVIWTGNIQAASTPDTVNIVGHIFLDEGTDAFKAHVC